MPRGPLRKMHNELDGGQVRYWLPVGDELIELNPLIGQMVQLRHLGEIRCGSCDAPTKKSYGQGHCWTCFGRLASCDICIPRPERCHFAQGTCRDPEWARAACMTPHSVYLAVSSGLKVGITGAGRLCRRWMDQGAVQGLEILRAPTRLDAGRCEVELKEHVSDRTDWRLLLAGRAEPRDLESERDRLLALATGLPGEPVPGASPVEIHYPVERYPQGGVRAHPLDEQPMLWGTLHGIKGQYLLFDTGVINVRKYAGYVVDFC